jgi:hypothetical protein
MKEFPERMNVKNCKVFNALNYDRVKQYMRKDIYEFVISRKTEDDYFELTRFNTVYLNDLNTAKLMIKELIPEIEQLGWKCKLGFGETGLFIFEKEVPKNCF